jgi:hypothetical protein
MVESFKQSNLTHELYTHTSTQWKEMTKPEILVVALPLLARASHYMNNQGYISTLDSREPNEDRINLYTDESGIVQGDSTHNILTTIKTKSSHDESSKFKDPNNPKAVVDLFRKYVLKESNFEQPELIASINSLVDFFGNECNQLGLNYDYFVKIKFTEGLYSAVGVHFFVRINGIVVPFEYKFNNRLMEELCNEEHEPYKTRKLYADSLYNSIGLSMKDNEGCMFQSINHNQKEYSDNIKKFMSDHLNLNISLAIKEFLEQRQIVINSAQDLKNAVPTLNVRKIAYKTLVKFGIIGRVNAVKVNPVDNDLDFQQQLNSFGDIDNLLGYIEAYRYTYLVSQKFQGTKGLVKTILDIRNLESEIAKSGLKVIPRK